MSNKTTTLSDTQYQSSYTYLEGINGSSTALVSEISNNGNTITYSYDAYGNIDTILENGKQIQYVYDELNQLVREDNEVLDKTITYTYDLGGNILDRKEYAYTTGGMGPVLKTYTYLYEDPHWKDKLTSFDGKPVTYDAIGNPLTYDDWTFVWEQGRQLQSMENSDISISYNQWHNHPLFCCGWKSHP
jgi:hypothetical protein